MPDDPCKEDKDEAKRFKSLLQCWTVAYEKAIVAKERPYAKRAIDKACREAVDQLTKSLKKEVERLKEEGKNPGYDIPDEDLQEATSRRFETMKASIEHHIENLKNGGIFTSVQEFKIEPLNDYRAEVLEITVENCTYRKGCEWAKEEPEFQRNGEYRCPRLASFVGAVHKYMKEDKLPLKKREKLDYHMESVIETIPGTKDANETPTQCRCKGFIFVDEAMKDGFKKEHPTNLFLSTHKQESIN
ncbi:hypothetical protein [Planktothrix mougeotii]|uniref:Uncharacterized protein n=1 Tax=Planktothrix mougeotii LEGE 06226 TaxID=1828728 RepID=A0ABR9UFA1_9CYAN|nr:hypothetical protein [Planktothrix mougeotii]MBE9145148.1 hypothetical protein [Planktothrix mougeotii LEGE 06226]